MYFFSSRQICTKGLVEPDRRLEWRPASGRSCGPKLNCSLNNATQHYPSPPISGMHLPCSANRLLLLARSGKTQIPPVADASKRLGGQFGPDWPIIAHQGENLQRSLFALRALGTVHAGTASGCSAPSHLHRKPTRDICPDSEDRELARVRPAREAASGRHRASRGAERQWLRGTQPSASSAVWPKMTSPGSSAIVSTTLDRLLGRSHHLVPQGRSYRPL
jgi:hypothetical protein